MGIMTQPDIQYELEFDLNDYEEQSSVKVLDVTSQDPVLTVKWTKATHELRDIEVSGEAADNLNEEEEKHLAAAFYENRGHPTEAAEHLLSALLSEESS